MTAKVCLRCDWEDETSEGACPDCGVPLYAMDSPARTRTAPPARNDREEPIDQPAAPLGPELDPSRRSSGTDASSAPGRVTRQAGAFVVAVLLLTAAFDAWLASDGEGSSAPPSSPQTSLDDLLAGPVSLLDLPAPPAGVGPLEDVPGGTSCSPNCRREVTVGDIAFSFRVPTRGWERFGDISINKSIVGPQAAEAIIYWTSIPGDYANPCVDVLGMPIPRSVKDVTTAVATAPGTELLVDPLRVQVGGRPATYVVLAVREDFGCHPGFFFIWHDIEAGAFWAGTDVGHTVRVWIVSVRRSPLIIVALTNDQANADLEQEIKTILRSFRFQASFQELCTEDICAAGSRTATTLKAVIGRTKPLSVNSPTGSASTSASTSA
jgi:hypothetical protein